MNEFKIAIDSLLKVIPPSEIKPENTKCMEIINSIPKYSSLFKANSPDPPMSMSKAAKLVKVLSRFRAAAATTLSRPKAAAAAAATLSRPVDATRPFPLLPASTALPSQNREALVREVLNRASTAQAMADNVNVGGARKTRKVVCKNKNKNKTRKVGRKNKTRKHKKN
jgi:hypothetical protein